MKIKAAVLVEQNQPLGLMELELPTNLGTGQVLVEMHAAGICGAQIGEITGAKGPDPYLPHLLGHEGAGRVIGCGAGVRTLELSDHVVCHWRKGIGIEAEPIRYFASTREATTFGAGPIATFATHAIISENRLTRINQDIPFTIAALFGCAVTTGFGLVENEAQLKIGQSIVVAGCGGVGLNVIQGAKLRGACPIIAIDRSSYALDNAARVGADICLLLKDPKDKDELYGEEGLLPDIVNAVMENGINIGPDVFVDCTGNLDVASFGWGIIQPGGKCILVGQPEYDAKFVVEHMRKNYVGKTLLDSQGGLSQPNTDIPRYIQLYRKGVLELMSLIGAVFPLEGINEAVALMQRGGVGRVILEMDHDRD